ncbi:baculoviral IAP repeat-containing protein 3-like [Haliotis rufescens]|uniref:baculoviral IAP repeat-containing protein 3-like n=1 Tax=Haliotis rufescens TaxID=6454 RepID=UPI00201F05BA|nr:baculoviral IAP repeat-containing protein 3-like [Haliotis rufescens]
MAETKKSGKATRGEDVVIDSTDTRGCWGKSHAEDAVSLLSQTPSHYYLRFERRLASFEAWPTQMYQTAEEMAHAGFVYTQGADGVCCFQCGVRLRQWAPHDNPWAAHHKWSPDCDYLKLTGLVKHQKQLQLHYLCEEKQRYTNDVARPAA